MHPCSEYPVVGFGWKPNHKKKKKKEATNLEDVQADDQILGALATPLANVRLRQLHHQLLVVVRYVEAILRR